MKANTALTSLVLVTFLCGCPFLKKKGEDAGGTVEIDIADAATVTVSGTGAKNEKDVLRYAKETKLADEPGVIAKDGTKLRTFPQNGVEVTTLAKGTNVTKLAAYFSTGVLLLVDDPAGGKLMGWVPPESVAAPASDTPPPTATPTYVPVVVKDAGSPAKDAGAGPKDAGAPKPQSNAQLFIPPGPGNSCPAGYALIGGGCRKPCNADSDCPRSTFCVPNAGKKACATSK